VRIQAGEHTGSRITDQGFVGNNDKIGPVDAPAFAYRLVPSSHKGENRCAASLGAVPGRILDLKPFKKQCRAEDTTGRLYPLAATTMEAAAKHGPSGLLAERCGPSAELGF
jgi:hypothetical protein